MTVDAITSWYEKNLVSQTWVGCLWHHRMQSHHQTVYKLLAVATAKLIQQMPFCVAALR